MRTALFAALAVTVAASAAHADFVFSHTRQVINSSYDRVTFYAYNDGTGYTAGGTKLLGLEIDVSSSKAIRFQTSDINSDGLDDINLTASAATIAGRTPLFTKLPNELFSPLMLESFPNNPNPENVSTETYDAVAAYSGRTTFGGLGVALETNSALTANVGSGAAFATIVTGTNASVTVSGKIGGDTGTSGPAGAAGAYQVAYASGEGPRVPYSYTAVVPEPATLTVAVAALGLIGRRRRAL